MDHRSEYRCGRRIPVERQLASVTTVQAGSHFYRALVTFFAVKRDKRFTV